MLSLRHLLHASAAAVLSFAGAANAALVVTLEDSTGTPLKAEMKFVQNGNNVDLTAKVITDANNPNTGDLRAVFFNLTNTNLINNLSASGTWFTQILFNTNDMGNGANVNPLGPYHVGIEIGTQGIGSDDIQLATFSLSSGNPLTLADFSTDPSDYALRATSVGLPGGSRSGSSKLEGIDTCLNCDPDPCAGPNPPPSCDPDPCTGPNPPPDCGGPGPDPNGIPEPVTASLGLLSVAGLFFATHRRRNA